MTALFSPGDSAPAFTLNNKDGNPISLSNFSGQWVVLYFYPKDNTTGCTREAKDFTALLSEFKKHKATVVGISADSEKRHANFIQKHDLKIELLSDPDHQALKAYGVWQKKKMAGREYMGIVRSTFLIDPDGVIQKVWSPVKVKDHAKAVKETLCGIA